ncbi:MAG: transcriptional regulator, LacI family [Chloroflexi bacterium]|nr:transcriptional regulator, LacI family [Chloroflexota bacterium]
MIESAPRISPMTLDEIARLSGVSRSTVSRVINDSPGVRQETRQRVLQIIQQMNYQPNVLARSLAGGRTRVLSLVIPEGVTRLFSDPYFPILIQGVSLACNAQDYSVMLWLADPDYKRRTISRIIQDKLSDGTIIASMLNDDPLVEALIEDGSPFILIGRNPNHENISYVDVDNQNGTHMAIAHLLHLGYRRIATITGPQNMIAGLDRLEGYLQTLRQWNLAVDPDLIIEGDFSEDGGYTAMRRLVPCQPEAVFIASDQMAIGALRALREYELRVPQDIAVIGFDDIPMAARTDPPLTTVRQPIQKTGQTAAETLIDMIEYPSNEPRRLILPTELVIRESCGSGIKVLQPVNLRPENFFPVKQSGR